MDGLAGDFELESLHGLDGILLTGTTGSRDLGLRVWCDTDCNEQLESVHRKWEDGQISKEQTSWEGGAAAAAFFETAVVLSSLRLCEMSGTSLVQLAGVTMSPCRKCDQKKGARCKNQLVEGGPMRRRFLWRHCRVQPHGAICRFPLYPSLPLPTKFPRSPTSHCSSVLTYTAHTPPQHLCAHPSA